MGFNYKKKQQFIFLFACESNKDLTRRPTYLPVLPVLEVFISAESQFSQFQKYSNSWEHFCGRPPIF